MSCPVCQGSQRRPIAPGYWECLSSITETKMVSETWVPGGPNGQMVPMPRYGPVSRICGTRYHESAATNKAESARCECGTFAIGVCHQCDREVCGDHSCLVAGARLCLDCSRQRDRDESAARRERDEKAARQAQVSVESRNAAIQAIADPIERLLTAMGTLKTYRKNGGVGCPATDEVFPGWQGQIAAACPSLASSMGEVEYDSAAVARWFVRRAVQLELPSTTFSPIVERKRFLRDYGKGTLAPVRAWEFLHVIEQSTRWGSASPSTLYILEDGRMLTPRPTSASGVDGPSEEVTTLPPSVLKNMSSALGLTPAAGG